MPNRAMVEVGEEGSVSLPSEVRARLKLHCGSKFLVDVSESEQIVTLRLVEDSDWRSLRGIIADSQIDTSQMRAEERAWELAHDERKFGPFPKP
ncbi:MAG: hypothetical protein ACYCSN_03875 [Acidobacteriaceae bacterium]